MLAADNSIGTWKVNLAKSTYTPAPMPLKSLTAAREATASGVKVTVTGQRADGTAVNASYTAKYDGSWTTVSGAGTPYDSIAIRKLNANLFTYRAKQTKGKYAASGRITVSKDGKTMTSAAKGLDANGAAISMTLVYDKQ
jgi:hypothetical protein